MRVGMCPPDSPMRAKSAVEMLLDNLSSVQAQYACVTLFFMQLRM